MNKQKGFTIIELIVVIAIIAILAAIVLFNVTTYLNKGRDGRIVEELHAVQSDVLSSALSGNGIAITSTTPCNTSGSWIDIATNLQKGGATKATCASAGGGASTFCACVQSLADTNKYNCVDATQTKVNSTVNCIATCSAGGTYACSCLATGTVCLPATTCPNCCNGFTGTTCN